MMTEDEIAKIVVNLAYKIHTQVGPGLLESAYESILIYELQKSGLKVEKQVPVPIKYGEITLDEGFRADLIVERKVIIELKSIEAVQSVHKKQLMTYLRLMDYRLGLLINFGATLIKDGITRLANGLKEDRNPNFAPTTVSLG